MVKPCAHEFGRLRMKWAFVAPKIGDAKPICFWRESTEVTRQEDRGLWV
jgi:hypothetical protein